MRQRSPFKLVRQILKEALTVCIFIDEIQESILYDKHDIPDIKLRLAKKVVKNFLKRLKESEYFTLKDSHGETYYKRIQDHLESNHHIHDSTAVYLTYIQMQIHDFARHFLPNTIGHGGYRRNPEKVSYYKPILEVLTR